MEESRASTASEIAELKCAIENRDLAKAQSLLNAGNINHVLKMAKPHLFLP